MLPEFPVLKASSRRKPILAKMPELFFPEISSTYLSTGDKLELKNAKYR
jgi:hypothetical protein